MIAYDFYKEPLEVGQKVILLHNDLDTILTISDIHPGHDKEKCFISLKDENGNIVERGLTPKRCANYERYLERKNKEYVYFLELYNSSKCSLDILPLTATTSEEYPIDENISYIILCKREVKLGKNSESKVENTIPIYLFLQNSNVTLKEDVNSGFHYAVINGKKHLLRDYTKEIKRFNSTTDFQEYIKRIIMYFKNTPNASIPPVKKIISRIRNSCI